MSPGGDDDSNISLPGLEEEKDFVAPEGSIENNSKRILKIKKEKS